MAGGRRLARRMETLPDEAIYYAPTHYIIFGDGGRSVESLSPPDFLFPIHDFLFAGYRRVSMELAVIDSKSEMANRKSGMGKTRRATSPFDWSPGIASGFCRSVSYR
jgi:hypothetical protein